MNSRTQRWVMIALSLCVTVALTGCATKRMYTWGKYDEALYGYYKNPENRDKLESALLKAIEDGETKDQVAPSLYAEYAFLLLEKGDTAAAITFFEKEKAKWPESTLLMDKMIAQCTASKSQEQTQTTSEDASR